MGSVVLGERILVCVEREKTEGPETSTIREVDLLRNERGVEQLRMTGNLEGRNSSKETGNSIHNTVPVGTVGGKEGTSFDGLCHTFKGYRGHLTVESLLPPIIYNKCLKRGRDYPRNIDRVLTMSHFF